MNSGVIGSDCTLCPYLAALHDELIAAGVEIEVVDDERVISVPTEIGTLCLGDNRMVTLNGGSGRRSGQFLALDDALIVARCVAAYAHEPDHSAALVQLLQCARRGSISEALRLAHAEAFHGTWYWVAVAWTIDPAATQRSSLGRLDVFTPGLWHAVRLGLLTDPEAIRLAVRLARQAWRGRHADRVPLEGLEQVARDAVDRDDLDPLRVLTERLAAVAS